MVTPQDIFIFLNTALAEFCKDIPIKEKHARRLNIEELYLWFILGVFSEWLGICEERKTPTTLSNIAIIVMCFEGFRHEAEPQIERAIRGAFRDKTMH